MPRIKVQNQHVRLTGEPRGNHLTNRCLTVDARVNGFYMEGWRGEVQLDIDYQGDYQVEIFYGIGKKEPEEIFDKQSGVLYIDVLLGEKPLSNVFIYALRTENLNFFYQPELTQEEVTAGNTRPDDVIGSYSVYHATKRDNHRYKDGTEKNYKTGKAFHIFRPEAVDAMGDKVWCDLHINKEKTQLVITVPQAFLDSAKYPVIIDPNFGYDDTSGFTYASSGNNNTVAVRAIMGSVDGELQSITHWVKDYSSLGPFNIWSAIYTDNSGNRTPSTPMPGGSSASVPLNHDDWITVSISGDPSLSADTVYWLAFQQAETRQFLWDSIEDGDYAWDADTSPGTFPNPWSETQNAAYHVAIYATYDEDAAPITVEMQALSLTSSPQQMAISSTVALPMQALSLVSSGQQLDVAPGAVALPMQVLSLESSTGQTTVLSTVTLMMQALSLTSSAQQLNIAPGAIALPMEALLLESSAEQMVLSSGVMLLMQALSLASSAGQLDIATGSVTLSMQALSLESSAEQMITSSTVALLMQALSLTSSAEQSSIAPGTVALSMQALSLESLAEQMTILSGVTLPMQALSLTSSAKQLDITPGAVALPMQSLSLESSAGQMTVYACVAIPMEALSLGSSVGQLNIATGPVALTMQALSLSALAKRLNLIREAVTASTKLTTFRQMKDAVIHSASSEVSAHLSDNLVLLEPNFYWESNQSDYQHQIVIDLGEPYLSNIVVIATRNVEDESTLDGINATISYSDNGVDFTEVSNAADPGIMEGRVFKPFRFSLTHSEHRYWKITISGYDSPNYYPPDPTRLAGIWVGRERKIGIPHAWPTDDSEIYPSDSLALPFGMQFNIGRSLRPHTIFSRKYLLTSNDRSTLDSLLLDSGTGMPIMLQEGDNDPMLARITGDINMQMMHNKAYIASMKYIKLPLLSAGEVY